MRGYREEGDEDGDEADEDGNEELEEQQRLEVHFFVGEDHFEVSQGHVLEPLEVDVALQLLLQSAMLSTRATPPIPRK